MFNLNSHYSETHGVFIKVKRFINLAVGIFFGGMVSWLAAYQRKTFSE